MFVVLQVVHLLQEWLQFAFKASEYFWNLYLTMFEYQRTGGRTQKIMSAAFLAPGVYNQRSLQQVVVMEMAIKIICSVFSAISIVTFVILMSPNLGVAYISEQYGVEDQGESTSNSSFIIFTTIATFTEVVNMALMNKLFFNPRGLCVFRTASVNHFRLRRCSMNCFGVSVAPTTTIVSHIVHLDRNLAYRFGTPGEYDSVDQHLVPKDDPFLNQVLGQRKVDCAVVLTSSITF